MDDRTRSPGNTPTAMATATPTGEMFRGLRALAEAAGDRFVRGVLLYRGATVLPFGKDLHAVPIAALWS